MSAALESLMRDIPRQRPRRAGGPLAFVLVGGAGALAFVVLSTMAIRLDTGLAGWVASTACYAALVVPVYLLHRRFSFASDAPHRQALPRYMAVQGMALLLAALLSFLAHDIFALPALPAAILVMGLTSGINFLVLRSWAFARRGWGAALPA